MRFFTFFLLYCLLGTSSCTQKNTVASLSACNPSLLKGNFEYNDLLRELPAAVVAALVESPDENGALGRNRAGYFHVRFQLHMTRLTDYALKFQNEAAVQAYLQNLNYSFSYQNPEGDFQFKAPEELVQAVNYQSPSPSDLASGTAFFAYSLGLSLNSLNRSEWYTNNASLVTVQQEIEALRPNVQHMLTYLKNSVSLLQTIDARAPNRLLFDAIAFYSLGVYLDDQEAKNIGIDFAKSALSQIQETEGYFIEGGGWDSSYNGVAIKLGLELFTLIPNASENSTKEALETLVSCATDWQRSRVLSTGEISTEGNTRVFPGGEEFLGNEKEVDVIKTVKAFFYMNALSNEEAYKLLAERIITFYN